jgi:hypothetical protein
MDPLITDGIDPGLMRVLERRGGERDVVPRRKRPPVPEKPVESAGEEEDEDKNKNKGEVEQELDADAPRHVLDDLA